MKYFFLFIIIFTAYSSYSQSSKTKRLKLKMAQEEYCNKYMKLLDTMPEAKKEFEIGKVYIENCKNYKLLSKNWNKNYNEAKVHLKNAHVLSGIEDFPCTYRKLVKKQN